jgi:hypothetical protein
MKKRGPDNIQEYVVEKVIAHNKYKDFEVNRLRRTLTKLQKTTTSQCPSCHLPPLEHTFYVDCDICGDVVHCTRIGCNEERESCNKCQRKCCESCLYSCMGGDPCHNLTCIVCSNGFFCFGCDLGSGTMFPCVNHCEVLQPYKFNDGTTVPYACTTCREFWRDEEKDDPLVYKDADTANDVKDYCKKVDDNQAVIHALLQ